MYRRISLPPTYAPGAGRSGQVTRWTLLLLLAFLPALAPEASAQAPLVLVDRQTTVSDISFKFAESQTFEAGRLKEQIATAEPNFWDRVKSFLPLFEPSEYPFSPVELQKDVVRLRHFYQRNGFLHPTIDYPASQLDTTDNQIRVIFTIQEGPPLIIQDVGFFAPDGSYAVGQFRDARRDEWVRFRDEVTLQAGARYTDFAQVRIQDQVLTWLKDRGYAFARVDAETDIDSTANTVDIRFLVDPGPLAYFDEIEIEGNESVTRQVVLRELPFKRGDLFSASKLAEGQRELFALNLFRVAIAEVPEQPADSTVTVRIRVREAQPRRVTALTGYREDAGATIQGDWRHRNFMGGARVFTVSAGLRSGIGATTASTQQVSRGASGSLSLQQPYLFINGLSSILSPFFTWEENPNQDLAFYELGLTSTLFYEIMPFRTVTLEHRFSRAFPIGSTTLVEKRDIYNRSIFSLSANLGRTDDYLNPRSGFLLRPFAEAASELFGSNVTYYKGRLEAVGYLPLGRRVNLNGRLSVGRLTPTGASQDQNDPQVEFRFDRIRFYAGGGSDVRGWPTGLLGPKIARANVATDSLGVPQAADDGTIAISDARYEAIGGLAKVAGNIELRLPFPGLGSNWATAAFIDFGEIFPSLVTVPSPDVDGLTYTLEQHALHVGLGAGLRYLTPVGYIRLDLAYKVNPSNRDLQDPAAVFKQAYAEQNPAFPAPAPESSWTKRFNIHLSIGQAF